jgi:hypothetical protein
MNASNDSNTISTSHPDALNHNPNSAMPHILTSDREAMSKTSGTKLEAGLGSQFCVLNFEFKRFPGESPRAYSAFMTFFQLGHARTLPAVAEKLDEGIDTIRKWSSKFDWSDRIQSFNAGILQQHAEAEAIALREQAAEWSARMNVLRREEWAAAQKLLTTVHCFLETCSEEQMQKMTLSQVARALNIGSNISRLAITGAGLPEITEPTMSPIQLALTEALKRAYGDTATTTTNPNTTN